MTRSHIDEEIYLFKLVFPDFLGIMLIDVGIAVDLDFVKLLLREDSKKLIVISCWCVLNPEVLLLGWR